jgi:hypothetical protein
MRMPEKATALEITAEFLLMLAAGIEEMEDVHASSLSAEKKLAALARILTAKWERDYYKRNNKMWLRKKLRMLPE